MNDIEKQRPEVLQVTHVYYKEENSTENENRDALPMHRQFSVSIFDIRRIF